MTEFSTQTARKGDSDRLGWCFASGRVAALEGQLLGRSFFHSLIESGNLGEARSALAKTAYRSVFTTDESVKEYPAAIEEYSARLRDELTDVSPKHAVFDLWAMPARYRTMRTLFLRSVEKNASGDELAEVMLSFAGSEAQKAALARHAEIVRGRRFAGDQVATSMLLDSAEVTALFTLAQSAPEETVKAFIIDRAVLSAWSAVLRSTWNGTDASFIAQWFVLPAALGDLAAESAAAAESDPAAALGRRVSAGVAGGLAKLARDEIRADVDLAMSEAISENVRAMRMSPFGPERLISYLVALDAEETNLRIALATVAHDMDRKAAYSRLRREYA